MYQNVSIVLAHTTLAAVGDYIHIIIMGRVIISNNKNKNDWVKKKKKKPDQIKNSNKIFYISHIIYLFIYLFNCYLPSSRSPHTYKPEFFLFIFIYIYIN